MLALKEEGIFRGAKRKLKFTKNEDNSKPSKCGKIITIGKPGLSPSMKEDIFEFKHKLKHMNVKHESTTRMNVKLNLTRSSAGWHGKKNRQLRALRHQRRFHRHLV